MKDELYEFSEDGVTPISEERGAAGLLKNSCLREVKDECLMEISERGIQINDLSENN